LIKSAELTLLVFLLLGADSLLPVCWPVMGWFCILCFAF
jgi:hypothetical protein